MSLTRTPAPSVEKNATPVQYVKDEGVYGGGFWLNQEVKNLPLPFPNSPEDLFFRGGTLRATHLNPRVPQIGDRKNRA